MSSRRAARRRLGSIRVSLVLLAVVPGVTLAAMWGVTTIQMFSEGLRLREQTQLSRSTGAMGTEATLALQRERLLSAAWLSGHGSRGALEAQRRQTDDAVEQLVRQSDLIERAPARIEDRLYSVVASVGSLEYYRGQVDDPTDITAGQALEQYTSIIDDQIHAFEELSQVDDGDLASQAGPLVALEHAGELASQEDALLTLAWRSGYLDGAARAEFARLVITRRWIVQDQIMPSLRGTAKAETERILHSPQWRTLEDLENQVLTARADDTGKVALPDVRKRWSATMGKLSEGYTPLIQRQTRDLVERSADRADELLLTAASLSAGGLVALLLCVGMSWRITRSLSRRLRGLRVATLRLAEERLPEVVARLDRGETVDVESAAPPLDYGHDELGQVAQAFNTAQRTAVHTAVELADTRRGFQKVILGIARQSQNLVNLQLSKLDALEREHSDPEVLKGLYELDSTASQLRRYEENLVIISGEQPRRSWREPVALLDILRSAVSEVAEYRRVEVRTEESEEGVCLAPPAVADVIHLLAELIDNATVYSPAPSPVEVRAVLVAKGLAVEIEDRGLGMPEDDYASLNAQLAVPPEFDVVALADDLRLGMFVVARLAHRHGIGVTLRPSPYGGTTAVVLIPHEVVVREEPTPDPKDTRSDGNAGGAADAGVTVGGANAGDALGGANARDTVGGAHAGGLESSGNARDTEAPGNARKTESSTSARDTDSSTSARDTERPGSARDTEESGSARDTEESGSVRNGGSAGGGRHGGAGERDAPAPGAGRATPAAATRAVAASRSAVGTLPETAAPALTPLPRRVPQTSLAAELREEPAGREEAAPHDEFTEFTAERAASSLAGFQRGTLKARREDAAPPAPGEPSAHPPTPPADR
ncbi:nitrate- and nitrite sensing domain-containing protein [Streptomyces sp. DH24]|uniref:sensor histidine kinase n=1 Tax=Streptomyces sp. DH24 TaxID=3040123 RepID=UPI0024420CE5|nr:nitrate- and nitrite sensing domain-containing protein [Streptomyces sp. DH24]MDG9717849.1 nitrate- and nitrite sensing domain-containing protein [Streptomyces sp. DH24]